LGHAIAIDPGSKAKQGGSTGLFAYDMDFLALIILQRILGW